jgi:large conductance mechanosensitive channel
VLEEFKKFAFKGNVVDLAVGVIIGGAFGNVVKALTDWIIMPVLGLLTGGIDFTRHYLVLKAPKPGDYPNVDDMVTKGGAVILRWGAFINTIITFFLVALAVFFLVKAMNRALAKKEAAAPPPAPTPTEELLAEIRDLLKAQAKS